MLGRFGIRTVFGLRTEEERGVEPDDLPDGAQLVVCDVLADSQHSPPAQLKIALTIPLAERMLGGGNAVTFFEAGYREIVSLPSALAAYRHVSGAVERFLLVRGERVVWVATRLMAMIDMGRTSGGKGPSRVRVSLLSR